VEPWIVVVIVVGVPAFLLFSWWQNKKLKERARQVAAAAGLNIDVDAQDPPADGFALMDRGHSRRVTFRMWATGSPDEVFQYQYTTGSGKNRTTFRFSCALISLPFFAPHVTIGREGFWSNLGQVIGIRDIEIESPEFNDCYRVSSDDERFAVTLLDHEMIAWMLGAAGGPGRIRFELLGSKLLGISEPVGVEGLPGLLEWTAGIREHLPAVLTELYPARR
jgi:hypothetical protein